MHSARIQCLVKKLQRPRPEIVYLHSRHSERVFSASHEEINRICDEFHRIPDKYALFESMFLYLFSLEDIELHVHFQLDSVKEEDLRQDQRFRTHVGKFQRFMTSIIDMIEKGSENAEQLVQVLRAVGRQHGNVRSMSFTAEKWLLFKNAMIALFCKDSDKSYSTWSRLISFIIFEIKDGYLEHVRHARSSSCPIIEEHKIFRRSLYRKASETKVTK